MSFLRPDELWWLAGLLPLLALALWAAARARARRAALLGDLADELLPGFSAPRRVLRDAASVVGLGAAIVALAGPLHGTWLKEIQQRGVDVMVVLDTSRSMLAEDLPPNRLARAQREVRGLLERLLGHRLGLVTFAGDARVVCPLTHDANTFRLFLDGVDSTSNATGGTAIGAGLNAALDAFDEEYPADAVVILLTDGEDSHSDPAPDQVAHKARARGVPIHVVCFGTPEGGQIPVPGPAGTTLQLKDKEGQVVTSVPDEDLLERIAAIADGSFLSAARTAFPLDEVSRKRIEVRDGVSRTSAVREEGIDRFQWAVGLALLCLALRHGFRDGRMAP